MYNFEPYEHGYEDRSFDEILLEAAEMGLWDDEQIDHKDHGNTGGYLVYYGDNSIHLIELLYA